MIWVRAAVQDVYFHFFQDILGIRADFGVLMCIYVIRRAGDVQSTGKDFLQFLGLGHLLRQDWLCEI